MSNKFYKQIADGIIVAILISGIIIALVTIFSFFSPSPSSWFYSPDMSFRYRLLGLMTTIFMLGIASSIAISFILVATRRLRETSENTTKKS